MKSEAEAEPNEIAPPEPPLPVSGSSAPVHRTLDSLPVPDFDGLVSSGGIERKSKCESR